MLLDGSVSLPYNKVKYLYNNFTILSQQNIRGRLLWVVIGEKKNNFNNRFKLKTNNNLSLRICCENIIDIVLPYNKF